MPSGSTFTRTPCSGTCGSTQSDHDIAAALARHVGARDATWTAFAARASRQAGLLIRLERLPDMPGPGEEGLIDRLDDVLDEVSGAVSLGNHKVYIELGPLFARFLPVLQARDPQALAALVAELDPAPGAQGARPRCARPCLLSSTPRRSRTPSGGSRASCCPAR